MTRVAFQGEPGAYGEEAVHRYFGLDAIVVAPMPTFSAVCRAVVAGDADAALLPLENSLAGTVGDALDALATGPLTVVGEVLQPIDHQLLVLPGTRLSDIREVRSHWQALAQCEPYLAAHGWDLVPAADTAGAARQLAADGASHVAAVASRRAGQLYGLEVAAADIQAVADNVTRFAVLARSGDEDRVLAARTGDVDGEHETLITFETGHEPGDLVRALGALADAGINLSRVESRPSGDGPWRYRFLIQVGGDAGAEPLLEALERMRAHTTSMRVLGTFIAG